jgi:short-subunit dehydrogenase
MFNNAGIGIAADVRDMDMEHWQEIININLMGVIYGTLAAYKVMTGQGFGHIVNTASLAGLVPIPITTAYTMTKHGVVGLSLALRAEAKALGVKVSVVCPGMVDTNIIHSGLLINVDRKEAIDSIKLKLKLMDPARAARSILKGVRKNRSIIKVTLHARIFWWLFRINSSLFYPFCLQSVKDFRKMRGE